MRGLVKHEKRNMLIITLVFTIVVWFVLQGVIANDIAGNGNQINNFDGYIYNNYGNLFLGTLNQYYELFIIYYDTDDTDQFCCDHAVSGKQYFKMR